MNSDQEWIVNGLLADLQGIEFSKDEPLYKIDRRQRLAEMVLAELSGDTPEGKAWRDVAEAVRDLCLSPLSAAAIGKYNSSLVAVIRILREALPG